MSGVVIGIGATDSSSAGITPSAIAGLGEGARSRAVGNKDVGGKEKGSGKVKKR
jgi:hypothetical protein